MQSTPGTLQTIHYPSSTRDEAAVDQMRTNSAPFKGAIFGPEGRESYDALMNNVLAPDGVRYEAAIVGGVPGFWCYPTEPREGVSILFLHGGGCTMGSAHAYRHFAGHFARRTQARTFVADYRLAPEHPFPAALEDAHAAYLGLMAEGARQIVVIGDSAGGGLTLSLLALLPTETARTAIRPTAAVVMSPWTDLSMSGDSIASKAEEELYLTKDMMQACADMYLGGESPSHPRASALNASLVGLPPLQIHVGTSEVLLDDSIRFARRVQGQSISVSLHTWQGMPHVFQNCLGLLQAADQSVDIMTAFIVGQLVSNERAVLEGD